MATLLTETFEGDFNGFDNDNWVVTEGAGCTVDQDSSMPSGSNAALGTECLFLEVDSLFDSANVKYTLGATTNVSYVRFYFYINVFGIENPENCMLLQIYNDNLDVPVYCELQEHSDLFAQPVLVVNFYSDGVYIERSANVVASKWYCVEIKYDASANSYEWKLDGTSKHSGSLVNPYTNMELILVGTIQYGGDEIMSNYIDAVEWSNSDFPGPLYSEGRNTTLLTLDLCLRY